MQWRQNSPSQNGTNKLDFFKDTIAAISTPAGVGGIAVVRVSGPEALAIVNSAWKGTDLLKTDSHTAHFGKFLSVDGKVIDEGLVTIFKSPNSFTGENVVEIGIHGSVWIQKEILTDLVNRGARIANPGEFTQRAFLNGKLDLAQAEGVADLIASTSKAAHDMALSQTRGAFSKEFNDLREKLIEFASLLELELDFSEEDVEFADRTALVSLLDNILSKVKNLASSYSRGAVMKNGVPVVIAGIPNAGKSSLLNLLINDDKAIVTDIPGTTRDIIEDTTEIDGILFRFIDTAGLRETDDFVEGIGVNRAYEAMKKAFIVIWMIDHTSDLDIQLKEMISFAESNPSKPIITLINKSDLLSSQKSSLNSTPNSSLTQYIPTNPFISSSIPFSTLTREGLDSLVSSLISHTKADQNPETDVIVTNARHYEALTHASASLQQAIQSLNSQLSGDFIAQDVREAISHLATITGAITTDNLLHSIFSRFCIGK